jgi:hypothetical protein
MLYDPDVPDLPAGAKGIFIPSFFIFSSFSVTVMIY